MAWLFEALVVGYSILCRERFGLQSYADNAFVVAHDPRKVHLPDTQIIGLLIDFYFFTVW